MQAITLRPTRRFALCQLALPVIAACVLAACDKHSAQEVPESYGHGSAHEDSRGRESFGDHRVDSSGDRHFSDTQGTAALPGAGPATNAKPSPAPASTPAGHFF